MKVTFEVEAAMKSKYPCIKEILFDERHYIVLFMENNMGICLYSNYMDTKCGDYSIYWDEANFTPFKGQIILKND